MWPHLAAREAVNLVSSWAAKTLRKEVLVVEGEGESGHGETASWLPQARVLASFSAAASGLSPCIGARGSWQLQVCILPAWWPWKKGFFPPVLIWKIPEKGSYWFVVSPLWPRVCGPMINLIWVMTFPPSLHCRETAEPISKTRCWEDKNNGYYE